jgi:hypothetical protein
MGCSFAGLPSPLLNHTLQRMHPAKFPAILRLHQRGRERDLIEARLNEAAAMASDSKKILKPVVLDGRQARMHAQLGRYGTDVARWGK